MEVLGQPDASLFGRQQSRGGCGQDESGFAGLRVHVLVDEFNEAVGVVRTVEFQISLNGFLSSAQFLFYCGVF